jgi:hypothetical protein
LELALGWVEYTKKATVCQENLRKNLLPKAPFWFPQQIALFLNPALEMLSSSKEWGL